MEDIKFPTEMVELPSKGLIYPKDHPLRSGKVEMKYMTAKEEDILTNQNLIEKGIVLERLLEALTMKKFDVKDIATGDKNAIFMGARILGYGAEYTFMYDDEEVTMDLSTIEPKPFDTSLPDEDGYINFTLPKSQLDIKFKILTESDEAKVANEVKSLAKFKGNSGGEVTTRLKYQIISVSDNNDKSEIKSFIENNLLAQDSRALRKYIKEISPDVDLNYTLDSGKEISIPISLNFFWPDL